MRIAPSLAVAVCLAAAPAAAKTLVFCSEGDPRSLNPQLVTDTTGMNAGRPMFDSLVELETETLKPVPGLAESWDVSEDGRAYTFRLRRGVKFHSNDRFRPSRDFNADDVIFSLGRQWREDHPFHKVSGGHYDYFRDVGMPDLLERVEKLDDHTLRITIRRPEATFLPSLGMPFNVILSAEYGAQLEREGRKELIDEAPVGTGPFVFAGYQKDVVVRYRAFGEYWGWRQPIDTLVFSVTPNAAVRLTKLKSGECHVMAYPNPADIGRIAADSSLVLLSQEGLNIGYLGLHTGRRPFDDLRVRRALNMAIDKAAIVQAVYGGAGRVATNPIPPMLWSYNAEIADYPFDPEGARRLLAEAGYAAGFETELWYLPVSRPYNPNGKRVAEMMQADLAKLGIQVRLMTADWSAYRTKLLAGEAPMALYGWTGDIGDPDNFLDVLLGCTSARPGGNNIAKWCDRGYDELVTRAKRSLDRAERERLYREAQVIAKREAPWVPIAHSVVYMAARKEVSGFRMDLLGRHRFDGVDLK
ncbi:ABC transporter substrate-binding protein [Enterovirga aerilata]|uniref:ABC transporter substrate-binding protein n=1 Tax=Enterovirga aerilata TaxID=2730920 RepID=A0A849I5R3_9HYPH|nr:ABC transporter substrate-binding protein [Enterovirga sp. DB1703]NNM73034.1 ABC transporter substrate-binding protein [Enterovirga sp. DB1703]